MALVWENYAGNPIPEWLQGRGTGAPGERLVITLAPEKSDEVRIESVEPGDYVVRRTDGWLTVARRAKVDAVFE